jgi:hypothetical protein
MDPMTHKPDVAPRRTMIALIALADDLPVPNRISFVDDRILAISCGTLAQGQAWSAHLGGKTETYTHDGAVWLDEGLINWRGWRVQVSASEPNGTADGLDDSDRAALTELVAS